MKSKVEPLDFLDAWSLLRSLADDYGGNVRQLLQTFEDMEAEMQMLREQNERLRVGRAA